MLRLHLHNLIDCVLERKMSLADFQPLADEKPMILTPPTRKDIDEKKKQSAVR